MVNVDYTVFNPSPTPRQGHNPRNWSYYHLLDCCTGR